MEVNGLLSTGTILMELTAKSSFKLQLEGGGIHY